MWPDVDGWRSIFIEGSITSKMAAHTRDSSAVSSIRGRKIDRCGRWLSVGGCRGGDHGLRMHIESRDRDLSKLSMC